ncbi:MAG: hypothetical protein ACXWJD_10280, partial [Burkholderiaceae bacterium]
MGRVGNQFESANQSYALQAQAQRRVIAGLWQGAATTVCDAYGWFPPGSCQNVRLRRCVAS